MSAHREVLLSVDSVARLTGVRQRHAPPAQLSALPAQTATACRRTTRPNLRRETSGVFPGEC